MGSIIPLPSQPLTFQQKQLYCVNMEKTQHGRARRTKNLFCHSCGLSKRTTWIILQGTGKHSMRRKSTGYQLNINRSALKCMYNQQGTLLEIAEERVCCDRHPEPLVRKTLSRKPFIPFRREVAISYGWMFCSAAGVVSYVRTYHS